MTGQLDQLTLDYLIEGFQLISTEWRYLYANESVVKQSKFSREELIGFTMMEKYPGIENTDMFRTLERCMQERVSEQIENEFKYPDGSSGWFELHIQPVPEGIFILSMDISRRKKAETDLKRLNENLEEMVVLRTQQLESINKDIVDSLHYAKNIQKALMPDKSGFVDLFPDSFIVYKPKHIVSGDFYFFHKTTFPGKNEELVYVAAADCTGHGVPGAMVSMIGIEKLNNAFLQNKEPGEILQQLNKGIKTAFSNTSRTSQKNDGMDIAICTVDRQNKLVKFAGANRPIWIIRRGGQEVEEIKATKKAIGGHTEDDQLFESRDIKLEDGDTFYMFSDGYADQFGGELFKKLTTKKFKELLLSIQYKTMHDQKEHLVRFIETWAEGTEQVDDILVIGVRL